MTGMRPDDVTPANDPIAEATRQWVARGWAEAADGMAAVTSLMRAHQIAVSRVEAVLKPFDITFSRYEVLMLLYFSRLGSLPMGRIGSRLQIHQTSVTNAVDRLEVAGFVRRIPHPSDRRATLVEILPSGRKVADRATKALNQDVFRNPGLTPSQVKSLIRVLGSLRKNAGDF